ncbi:MAG: glycoside hydrolase family 27 protein [Terriglobia bacterium]
MGWSTWYMAYTKVSDKLLRREADALISSGLSGHGYSYVDIDDGWNVKVSGAGSNSHQAPRDAQGNLKPNSKFPNMKALTSYVHSKGLKIGIYISPGPRTCGGYEGSYGHEKQDAQLFAKWGFDLLKYDLCSYRTLIKNPRDATEVKQPYQLMGSILQNLDRDLVFNLCEYGLGHVWTWGREVGGNSWRTNGDVGAQRQGLWEQMTSYGLAEAGEAKWAGPGGWNDPDNILIGQIIWKGKLRPTPLTHNEQYTYVTLWSLLDAPLIFGGDMTQLDPFTLSLLTNDEVIAVDQDRLGQQAVPVFRSSHIEVWAKDMEDGSKAVGLFNLDDTETEVTARWSDLGISGKHLVRDLWRQKDLGVFDGEFHASVGEHGAELFLVRPIKQKGNYK